MAKKTTNKIWFPAKKHGYGWGAPVVWQGWAVLIGCLVSGLAPLFYVSFIYKGDTYCRDLLDKGINVSCNPDQATWVYMVAALMWLIAMVLLLATICTQKGEALKWRWAKKKEKKEKHAKKS